MTGPSSPPTHGRVASREEQVTAIVDRLADSLTADIERTPFARSWSVDLTGIDTEARKLVVDKLKEKFQDQYKTETNLAPSLGLTRFTLEDPAPARGPRVFVSSPE